MQENMKINSSSISYEGTDHYTGTQNTQQHETLCRLIN